MLHQIGKGKFSTVFECKDIISGKNFAVKIIEKPELQVKEHDFIREEIMILEQVSHPNVIEMKRKFETLK